jgi:hypothetical protein
MSNETLVSAAGQKNKRIIGRKMTRERLKLDPFSLRQTTKPKNTEQNIKNNKNEDIG